jgi:ABC-type polysaccharide/polyol phosphate export permease
MLARRDLKNRYASSYAGVAWNIGVPLLYALINVVVFSVLMSGRMGEQYGNIPFALFFFVPFSLWTLFSDVTIRSTGILREYSYLINKIAFPVWVLPLVPFASALLSQAVILSITVAMLVYFGVIPADTYPLYLVTWLILLILTIGAAYFVSSLSVFVPDLVQAVPVGINILFWLTPILYPATLVENFGVDWIINLIIKFNPFYYLVDGSRHAVFGSAPMDWTMLGVVAALAGLVLIAGILVFRKLQPSFADVI